MLSDFRINTV